MEADPRAPGDEEAVVLVEVGLLEQVHAVLLHHDLRAARDVVVRESGNIPRANHPLRRDERGAGVHDGRPAIGAPEGERHRPVGGEKPTSIFVQRVGHLDLATGELVVVETRPLLEKQNA
jgi:hypothetical protein